MSKLLKLFINTFILLLVLYLVIVGGIIAYSLKIFPGWLDETNGLLILSVKTIEYVGKFFAIPGGVISVILLAIKIKEKTKPRHILDFNTKNTFFARFLNKNNKKTGNIGIAFYSLKIINVSDQPYTVKDIIFRYDLDGETFSSISFVLQTGIVPSSAKKDVNAIIVNKGIDKLVLMNWDNIRTELGSLDVLQPGGVLSGSAYFVLEFDDIEKLWALENVEIVIIDYSGLESIHPISIQGDWIKMGRDAFIQPRPFVVDGESNISFTK